METKAEPSSLWTKDFIKVGSTNFFQSFVMQVMITVFPLFLNSKGFSASMIGTVATCYTTCAMIMRFTSGNLIDRIGRRKIGLLGITLIGTAMTGLLIASLFEDTLSAHITLPGGTVLTAAMILIVLCRMLQGFGSSTASISTSTMLADILPRDRFAEGIGYSGLFNSLSQALGPAVGVILLDISTNLTFSTLIFVMAAAFFVMNSMKYESSPEYIESVKASEAIEGDKYVSDTHGIWKFFEKKALPAGALVFIMAVCVSAVQNFIALYAKSIGLGGIGLYFTIQACCMVIFRLSSGKLSKKLGVYKTIMLGFLLASIAFTGLSFVRKLWMLYICAGIYGFGAGMAFPTLQVLVMSGVSRRRRGTANSTYLASWDLGSGIGASIWGFTIDLTGSYSIIYTIAGIVMMLDILLAAFFSKVAPSEY